MGRQAPLTVLLALLLVALAPLLGLPGSLAADLQGIADLGPAAALVACCHDQEADRVVDALLGVSRGSEVLQGPLRAGSGWLQFLDRSTQQPSRLAAGLGAHVNADCHRNEVRGAESAATSIDARNGANNSLQTHSFGASVGAPAGHTFLISSHISARGAHTGADDNQRESPDAAATARGLDASGVI